MLRILIYYYGRILVQSSKTPLRILSESLQNPLASVASVPSVPSVPRRRASAPPPDLAGAGGGRRSARSWRPHGARTVCLLGENWDSQWILRDSSGDSERILKGFLEDYTRILLRNLLRILLRVWEGFGRFSIVLEGFGRLLEGFGRFPTQESERA